MAGDYNALAACFGSGSLAAALTAALPFLPCHPVQHVPSYRVANAKRMYMRFSYYSLRWIHEYESKILPENIFQEFIE